MKSALLYIIKGALQAASPYQNKTVIAYNII